MDSFIGEIRIFGFDWAPQGWALCNGQTASIGQYTALYSIIGIRYGGDGKTTFVIPNMQGYAPIGIGSGPGLTPRTLGKMAGTEGVTLTSSQMASHDHALTLQASSSTTAMTATPTSNQSWLSRTVRPTSTPAVNVLEFVPPPVTPPPQPLTDTQLTDATITLTGGGQAHENRQPYLAMNFCIALSGIYPVNPN
ncbi:MAG: tail fiber protein [Rhodospirillales bacterium]|nr:tail fiber protein [Rhodospirillales bacterium]